MNGDGQRRRRGPSITSLVTFFLIVTPLVYVLSYAPVVRFLALSEEVDSAEPFAGFMAPEPNDSREFPAYVPIDWLIDNTPIRRPLFAWSGAWGVREDFEYAAEVRLYERGAEYAKQFEWNCTD